MGRGMIGAAVSVRLQAPLGAPGGLNPTQLFCRLFKFTPCGRCSCSTSAAVLKLGRCPCETDVPSLTCVAIRGRADARPMQHCLPKSFDILRSIRGRAEARPMQPCDLRDGLHLLQSAAELKLGRCAAFRAGNARFLLLQSAAELKLGRCL